MKKWGFTSSKRQVKSLFPRKHTPIDLVEQSLLQLQQNIEGQQEDSNEVRFVIKIYF